MGRGLVRFEFNDLAVDTNEFTPFALLAEGDTEVAISAGVFRIEFNALPKRADGAIDVGLLVEDDA